MHTQDSLQIDFKRGKLLHQGTQDLTPEEKLVRLRWLAPQLENRLKSVDYEIARAGNDNVVCLAEGITPRPYNLTAHDGIVVVSTDLPEMVENQKLLAQELAARDGVQERTNLSFRAVDVVNQPDALEEAVRYCLAQNGSAQFTMNSEGLIPYFTPADRAKFLRNAHSVISRYGGTYITTDIMTKDRIHRIASVDPFLGEVMEYISGVTKTNLVANAFENYDAAVEEFEQAGFLVERTKLYQDGKNYQLASLAGLDDSQRARAIAMVNESEVWVLRSR